MRTQSIPFVLASFLLSCGFTMPALACPPPDCGDCCHWVSTGPGPSDGYCTLNTDADCGGCAECSPCYTCVSCSCEWDCTAGQCCSDGTCVSTCPSGKCCSAGTCVSTCPSGQCCSGGTCVSSCPSGQCCSAGTCVSSCPTGQCCDEGACVTTCPACKTCSSGVCEDNTVACVSSDKDEACVGCSITFTATTDPTGHEDDVSWSGGGTPSTGTGATFVTTWATTGTKTATASLCDSSVSEDVTIAEVASVTPDEYGACVNENITFTVTTNPAGHYDLVSWSGGGTPASQEGGQMFTTQWSTCGSKTVTATCGSSSDSQPVFIKGVASVTTALSEVCNGEDLVFEATTYPTGDEDEITWSGGGTPPTGTGPVFTTKWTTGSSGPRTVTASYCNDSKSKFVNVLFGCDCDRPEDDWQDFPPPSFGCPTVCSGTNTTPPVPDNCGNTLKIQCGPSGFCYYRFFYNSTLIGECPYVGGVNKIRYKRTVNGDRFYSTWHRSRDPDNDGSDADEGTKYKYDWVVWIYNCIDDIGPDEHCREHPTSWGDENFGDVSACE